MSRINLSKCIIAKSFVLFQRIWKLSLLCFISVKQSIKNFPLQPFGSSVYSVTYVLYLETDYDSSIYFFSVDLPCGQYLLFEDKSLAFSLYILKT